MEGVDHYEDFYAICDHMPGSDRALRVGGTVVFQTGGWSARLEDHGGPPKPNQLALEVDLVLTPPEPGTPVPEVLTPVVLDVYRIPDPPIEYEEVYFFVTGSDDEAPPVAKVDHPE